ncbi:hypothetical protein FSP39_015723 [Pinctada imbricata]|uniref:PLAT domain-containing protein n=1 Tax=Pinctada imbricata TaxID=66713 RepID=A0AA88XSA4_PINIB|nr:hypothetical protein FSP39_015723 [Pinctada imbricata]
MSKITPSSLYSGERVSTNTDTLALQPKYLDYGDKIRIKCTVNTDGKTADSTYYFTINEPPYNGTCTITPETGRASLDYFEIKCSSWKDEEDRYGRDLALDNNVPLVYKVYQISNSTSNDTSSAVLSETPEPVSKALLSIGDPNNDYTADVRVKITDKYNGITEYYLDVKVTNPLKEIFNDTSNMNTEELITEMSDFVDKVLEDARATKDPIMVMKASESLASVITDFPVENRTNIDVSNLPTNWQDGLLDASVNGTMKAYEDMLTDILQKPVDKYQEAASQKVQNLTQLMFDELQTSNSSTFYSIEITANAFANVIANPDFTNAETAILASQALGQLIESFSNISLIQVTPDAVFTSGTTSFEDSKEGLVLLINNVVTVTIKSDLHNDSDAILAAQAVSDSRKYVEIMAYMQGDIAYALIENASVTPEERVGLYFMRSRIAELDVKKQKELVSISYSTLDIRFKAAITGDAVDSALESVTKTLLAVICKGCTDITEKSNTLVYVQKDSLGEMNVHGPVNDNTTINRIAVGDAYLSLTFPNSLTENPKTNYSTVMFSASVLKRNTYIYDSSSIGVLISSPVYKLTMTGSNQEPITLPLINIYEPTEHVYEEEYLPTLTPDDASQLFYHSFLYRKIGDYVCIQIDQSVQPVYVRDYTVYLRQETFPTHLDYDMKTVLSYDKDWMSCFPPEQITKTGLVYVGLSATPVPGETGYEWTPTEGKYYPGTYNVTDPRLSPYKIKIITSGCETWNEKKKEWSGTSCAMDWYPPADMISCNCGGTKGMTFGNTFYVPPNTIDFSTVFLKFSPQDQAAVLATFSVVIVFYIILMLWGRHQDKKDIVKWGVTPLIDNFADDTYYYLVTVYTGMRRDAGTKSRIGFIVAGDDYDSGVRELYDGVREEFPTASVHHFLMATSFPLGELHYVYIFHDNSGEGAYSSWYLNRLDIEDLQERTRYVFLCGQWLSLDDEDSSVDAILPVCGKENVTTFQNMFYLNTKENLADNHMWVSIFYRPTSSNFTRCQRISCLLLFIMLTMIGNAIYFRPEDDFQPTSVVRVGPLQFSWRTVYISLASTLIATPAVLFSIILFKKAKPRKISTDVKDKSLKYAVPVLDNMMDKWLKESKELEQTLVAKGYFGMEVAFLPWWFIIIAWIIAIGGSITAAFFIMLYSMQWGKQKTELWLSQFALSFFQSIFIVDPLKVIVLAAVFAMILTQLEKFRPSGLKRDIILKNYRQRFGKESSIRIPVPPLSNDMLERARQDRMREVKMVQAIKEIIITVIFLWIIFSISYSNRDHRSYLIHRAVENQILTPAKPLQQYNQILTHDDYVKWLSETVFPAVFPEEEYNGERLHWRWRQYFSDLTNFRVGPPRLRQLRVTKTMEDIPIVGMSKVYPNYNMLKEEDRDFCFSWLAPPCDKEREAYSFSYRAWKFTKASDIWGIPIAGLYNTYGGGGYIAELDVNWDFSNRTLKELTDYLWLDSATRAVFLEILLYNPNSNIFIYCTFITEFPETGGIIKMYSMYPLRIYQHLGATGVYVILCEVCFILYLVALIARVTYGLYQHRIEYFKSTWRTVDFLGVIGGIIGIAMYFGRLLLANETMSNFRDDPKTFVNFQHIAIWDVLFVLLLGCLVFLATIRLLGILGYDKRIGQVFKVFDNCAWDLFWFGVLFFYIFLGYCAFGYLLFGRSLESYYNVFEAMGTLFISMIGKSKFTEMNEKDPVMAQFYFFTFILLMVYFLLTMFLAMLGESISVVQARSKVDRSEELVLYLIEKFKDVFGGKKSHQNNAHKSKFILNIFILTSTYII